MKAYVVVNRRDYQDFNSYWEALTYYAETHTRPTNFSECYVSLTNNLSIELKAMLHSLNESAGIFTFYYLELTGNLIKLEFDASVIRPSIILDSRTPASFDNNILHSRLFRANSSVTHLSLENARLFIIPRMYTTNILPTYRPHLYLLSVNNHRNYRSIDMNIFNIYAEE